MSFKLIICMLKHLSANSNESLGRTFRDSPEVDNIFRIDGIFPVGEFVNAKVVSASEYEIICTVEN